MSMNVQRESYAYNMEEKIVVATRSYQFPINLE